MQAITPKHNILNICKILSGPQFYKAAKIFKLVKSCKFLLRMSTFMCLMDLKGGRVVGKSAIDEVFEVGNAGETSIPYLHLI